MSLEDGNVVPDWVEVVGNGGRSVETQRIHRQLDIRVRMRGQKFKPTLVEKFNGVHSCASSPTPSVLIRLAALMTKIRTMNLGMGHLYKETSFCARGITIRLSRFNSVF